MIAPSEEPWVHTTRLLVINTIRALWASSAGNLESRADWLVAILPELADFCPQPIDSQVWENVRVRSAVETAMFFNGAAVPVDRLDAYKAWVSTRIIAPLENADPDRLERALAFFKAFAREVTRETP
jgi:hypothetical protein